jgi:hypothetical protein
VDHVTLIWSMPSEMNLSRDSLATFDIGNTVASLSTFCHNSLYFVSVALVDRYFLARAASCNNRHNVDFEEQNCVGHKSMVIMNIDSCADVSNLLKFTSYSPAVRT